MSETPGRIEAPGATVDVVATSKAGPLPFYMFEVYLDKNTLAEPGDFNGVDTFIALRIPPSSMRISSPIRADISIDLLGDITVAPGGMGLRRWSLGGSHGVGLGPEMLKTAADGGFTMAGGYSVRQALANFFETWVTENEKRRKEQRPLLRLLFAVRGGTLTEFQNEEWWIQPDGLPEDSRSAARPLSWEWSLSFLAIQRKTDDLQASSWNGLAGVLMPPSARAVLDKIDGNPFIALDNVIETAQKAKQNDILAKLKAVRDGLQSVRDKVSEAVNLYRSTVSGVSGYIRSCARLVQETMLLIDRSNLYDQPKREVWNALREVQDALGTAKMFADGYLSPYRPSSVKPHHASVQLGDTLQSIAAREFGDASRWHELVALNGLTFPYVDFSGDSGAPASEFLGEGKKVLGQGDTLKLPNTSGEVVPDDPVGTDLTDEGTLRTLVGGVANLRAALMRRLRTPRGYMPHHPEYGSSLPMFVGAPMTPALVLSLRGEVDRVLREDPRVVSVQSIGVSVDTDAIFIDAAATTALGPVSLSGSVGGLVPRG